MRINSEPITRVGGFRFFDPVVGISFLSYVVTCVKLLSGA
jgi:hypothetical protein